jgi:hypothetical protein
VRGLGKLIDRHPRRARRNTGIAWEQVLIEVVASHADHRDMYAFRAFTA